MKKIPQGSTAALPPTTPPPHQPLPKKKKKHPTPLIHHPPIHPHQCRVASCTHLEVSVTTACPPFFVLGDNTTRRLHCNSAYILRRPSGSVRSFSTSDSAVVHKVFTDGASQTHTRANTHTQIYKKNKKQNKNKYIITQRYDQPPPKKNKPLKIESSVSKSNPSRWHFLHSPVMVELYCRLQRDSMAGAGGKKCRLARSSISPLTLEPLRSTFFSFGNMRSGRLLLEM